MFLLRSLQSPDSLNVLRGEMSFSLACSTYTAGHDTAGPGLPLLSSVLTKIWNFIEFCQSKRMDLLLFMNYFCWKYLTWMQSIMSPVSRQRDHLDCVEAPQEAEQGLHSDHSTSTWPEPSSSLTSSSTSTSSSPLPSPLPEVKDFQFFTATMKVVSVCRKSLSIFSF